MNIIIPMAGLGKRLRPHTLTTPKPLLPIAGKPIVHRLVEDIAKVCPEKIDSIGFIIHPSFGKEVEDSLKGIAKEVGATGKIYYQDKAMGISHALLFAKELFKGKVIVAFADTLFKAEFKLDTTQDGIIWVQQVSDPSQFGVVRLDGSGQIIELVEKPTDFVSDLAIIGIYFFKDGEALAREMQYLIDHDIKDKGEFQFTSALQNFSKKGAKLVPGLVTEWLDCGNKNVTVQTNQRYLEFIKDQPLVSKKVKLINSLIIPPCFIGDGVILENSVIGPYVSVGENSRVVDSRIRNSIIQKEATLRNAMLENSMLGNFTIFEGSVQDLSLGDFNSITQH
ncbi:sugar phosphate nucleotidyltransferase [Chryseolinea sp. H1M3-3]|uniref:sugar phosphate nucleotidyltransferase n=1 Tax=Chryseolinea sp. H1M3-3 TaxID=3034144 RepID=UPI0023ED8664|nr:sugar phosphate nucleotidyltransferase [Chryseolinea sp. H1M3-3]